MLDRPQRQRTLPRRANCTTSFVLIAAFSSLVVFGSSVAAWAPSLLTVSSRGSSLTSLSRNPSSSVIPLYSTTEQASSINSTDNNMSNKQEDYPQYTPEQLKSALDGLLEGSSDPAFDGRHLFGYENGIQNPNHELSKLQAITATRIRDYERYLQSGKAVQEQDLVKQMQSFWQTHGPLLNLQTVIQEQAPRMALAAEFKRASPSKGNIAVHLNAGEQAQQYAAAGANIISVLTEPRWFLGSLEDMTEVRLTTTTNAASTTSRPAVLRKEFTTSKYQITEALANGADTILLIVAVLPQHLLKELIDHARSFGMEPLVEVHADVELEVAIQAGAKVIGVNNRNLHTFQMDLHTTEHVAEQLMAQGCTFDHSDPTAAQNSRYTLCALSGMSTAFDVDRYRNINVGMCLIGESLMRAADPKVAIAGLCLDPKDWENMRNTVGGGAYTAGTKLVKVCGITTADDALVACQAGANLIGVIFVPKSKRCVTADQAMAVVKAVRAFGERTNRETLAVTKPTEATSPISQLTSNAQALEASSRRPLVVGVFQNQSPEFIRDMVDSCGLDLVQLHGSEGMEAANKEICGVPAIRVVDIATDPETGKASENAVQMILNSVTTDPLAILLDTAIKGETAGVAPASSLTMPLPKRFKTQDCLSLLRVD
ncbi:indole-3-glycerol-phosphate synthase [Nitzschia inconspicua]|uniref:Indole-3-glycerol-phosphate synthase n=1 Tax=Nitzschia inconspicua TaxID=303405 RepID=A0A9K3Q2L3_9STRA|nr:indole-3-glycerol-phosphate synthase [Nitzschia inconspicua]